MAELCLGTVQFGMKYRIHNVINRQPIWEESFEMLDYAFENGISIIDTAMAYGEAEMILGEYFRNKNTNNSYGVISKLCPNVIEKGEKDVYGVIKQELEGSLKRIGINQLKGYLLHTPEYVYRPEIVDAFVRLKEEGYTQNIGISIYDIKEGFAAIDTGVMDYIQLPYSILDQRGIKERLIEKANIANITIFARSAFLQGLYMMQPEEVPECLNSAIPYLKKVEEILENYQVDKVSAILNFVKEEKGIEYLVFGVETKEQLKENIEKYTTADIPADCIKELKGQIQNVSRSIIIPSLWSNGKKVKES